MSEAKSAQAPEAGHGYIVDRVVVCDAYREPVRHYQLLAGGRSKLVDGRRPSMRYLASAKASKGGIAGIVGKEATLFDDLAASAEELNDQVNFLREEIGQWRSEGYPHTATVTRRLLEWWFERDDERRPVGKTLFFCQQEAVEAVIYLYEARRRQRMPETADLIRYALKLATGTGKTLVMALIILWATMHKRRVSGSTLSANFLVLAPNLTVRDRVWGTDALTGAATSKGLNSASPENLFDEFDMVPPEYREEFRPNVIVRNWQSIPLEAGRDDWIGENQLMSEEGRFLPASVLSAIQRRQRTKKNPRSAMRKVIGNWHDLIIINDEAHHVYGEKRTRKDEDSAFVKWSRIIETLSKAAIVPLVVDVSATPWYGSGSPKPEGTLFEWLVSDFSVYDAFESGLVKVVRLPDPSEEGAKYLDLWDLVKGAKTKEEYLGGCRGAVASIYAGWAEEYQDWERQFADLRPGPPPVLLVICDKAERAQWMREHLISDYDLLRNPESDDPSEWHTIQIDTKVFDADKGREAVLRKMVNTVGQKGKPGESVRCIVSVNMLSEGWDVKNVSHILGLRAFGSPLLTEQVVGRGLRRVDYSALNQPFEERMANPNRADEETVDAFGIPFVGFPVERRKRPKTGGWSSSAVLIVPVDKKAKYAVSLPNVRSWAVGVNRPLSECVTVEALDELVIRPSETPPNVSVKPVVGGQPEEIMTLERFRAEYPLMRSTFMLAQDLFSAVSHDQDGLLVGPTFEELLEVVTCYVDERVRAIGISSLRDLGIYYWRRQAYDVLENAIREAPSDMTTVPLYGEPRYLETGAVKEFKWPGVLAAGKKSHLSQAPCHTDLEKDFCDFLDGASDVVKYVKNERLGFSITYHDTGRPRQYFPDFAVLVREGGQHSWWLVETKGEIRLNTHLKSLAARHWCERMTRADQGHWRYLFVQQRAFEKASRKLAHSDSSTFAALVNEIERRGSIKIVEDSSPLVELQKFKSMLPMYSLEAAAGYFGEGRAVERLGWVEVGDKQKLDEKMFIATIVGHSMEPTVSDGDHAIFRADPAGTRQGKIILATGPITDPELGGSFTVKKYFSEKVASEDGTWQHTEIRLVPQNPDFEPIVVHATDDTDSQVRIVAEYLRKL